MHQALDQQLPRQAAASGAERRAHGELALSGRAAREQQARDVRARDEQHQHDDAEQNEQRQTAGPGHRIDQRHDVGAGAFVRAWVQSEPGAALRRRDPPAPAPSDMPCPQSRHHAEELVIARGIDWQRRVELLALGSLDVKGRRHHADNRVRGIVDLERAPEDVADRRRAAVSRIRRSE